MIHVELNCVKPLCSFRSSGHKWLRGHGHSNWRTARTHQIVANNWIYWVFLHLDSFHYAISTACMFVDRRLQSTGRTHQMAIKCTVTSHRAESHLYYLLLTCRRSDSLVAPYRRQPPKPGPPARTTDHTRRDGWLYRLFNEGYTSTTTTMIKSDEDERRINAIDR